MYTLRRTITAILLPFLLAGILIITCQIELQAQQIKSQAAFQLLQTANTLMEAQQLEAAQEYFKKGLAKAQVANDTYCEAYACQGLGTLYTKLDQPPQAVRYYQTAIKLYKQQRLNVIANVVETLLKSVQGVGDVYAGIEVGAKGIKLSVIEVKLSKDRQYDYTLRADTAINTDAASLSYQSEKETHDAIGVLWKIAKERYQIPGKRVHVVISSGLAQELDKYNKVEYFKQVIRPQKMDADVSISAITAKQEAELSMLGIVPQKDRFTADQLDIGSGNTKGGYFDNDKQFVPVTFPYGTKSFQRLIDKKESTDIGQFAAAAQQLWEDSIAGAVTNEFFVKRDFQKRDQLFLSGGIVWAMTSFLHPGDAQREFIEINSADIVQFRNLLVNNYEQLTQPLSLEKIQNPEIAVAARNNINRVMKTYDRKALTAGAIWMDELMKKVNLLNPGKKIIFPKYAYVGWISGYLIKKATLQYAASNSLAISN